jgi:HEAT repeat protein
MHPRTAGLLIVFALGAPGAAGAAAPPASRSFGGLATLIEGLKDRDVRQRRQAALLLRERGARAEAAAPALVAAFRDPDREVRIAAAGAVGKIGPTALDLLGPVLKDGDADARCSALEAIRHFGPKGKAAVPLVIGALKDRDYQVRTFASVALAGIGELAVPALVGALKDRDPLARLSAGTALVRLGDPAVKALAAALQSKDVDLRRGAANALGLHGPKAKAAVPALTAALRDADPEVRTNAALALRRMGPSPDRRSRAP